MSKREPGDRSMYARLTLESVDILVSIYIIYVFFFFFFSLHMRFGLVME